MLNHSGVEPSGPAALRDRLNESLDEILSRRLQVGAALLILIVAVVAVIAPWRGDAEPVERSLPTAAAAAPSESQPPVVESRVVVHVAGAVVAPGVYTLPASARAGDAVALAGGVASDADVERVNLAAKLVDGQRVYVVRKGQVAPPGEAVSSGGSSASDGGSLVDINTATAAELDALPGVGPATAAAIVSYRERHGPFRSVNDLGKVKGIGPAKLSELRSRARV